MAGFGPKFREEENSDQNLDWTLSKSELIFFSLIRDRNRILPLKKTGSGYATLVNLVNWNDLSAMHDFTLNHKLTCCDHVHIKKIPKYWKIYLFKYALFMSMCQLDCLFLLYILLST